MAIREYTDTVDYIKALVKSRQLMDDKPSWPKITTMTMFAKNVINGLKIQQVRNAFKVIGGSLLVVPKGKKEGFEWRIRPSKRGTHFYNCLSIGYVDRYSKKAVKLFTNGSIHVAGCCNLLDCKRLVNQLAIVLPLILNKPIDIHFGLFKIVMINTNFSLNKSLNLYKVIPAFETNKEFEFFVTYDPGSYAAVVVKFKPAEGMKKVTVNIFSTGNIGVAGAQTLEEQALAYAIVNRVIGKECRLKVSDTIQEYGVMSGYKFEDWVRCN